MRATSDDMRRTDMMAKSDMGGRGMNETVAAESRGYNGISLMAANITSKCCSFTTFFAKARRFVYISEEIISVYRLFILSFLGMSSRGGLRAERSGP
jgi:hypothetical protein